MEIFTVFALSQIYLLKRFRMIKSRNSIHFLYFIQFNPIRFVCVSFCRILCCLVPGYVFFYFSEGLSPFSFH